MRRTAIMLAGFVILLTLGATGQESRSEVSLQGTGFFTKDSNGQGISRTTTNTGGFLVGYRYHLNRWLSAEANYGFDRMSWLPLAVLSWCETARRHFPRCEPEDQHRCRQR
jgi:hypothetical protein